VPYRTWNSYYPDPVSTTNEPFPRRALTRSPPSVTRVSVWTRQIYGGYAIREDGDVQRERIDGITFPFAFDLPVREAGAVRNNIGNNPICRKPRILDAPLVTTCEPRPLCRAHRRRRARARREALLVNAFDILTTLLWLVAHPGMWSSRDAGIAKPRMVSRVSFRFHPKPTSGA